MKDNKIRFHTFRTVVLKSFHPIAKAPQLRNQESVVDGNDEDIEVKRVSHNPDDDCLFWVVFGKGF
jgi:hypothetical protein